MYFDVFSGILSNVLSGILSDVLSDIYFGIRSDILSEILPDILSGILFWHFCVQPGAEARHGLAPLGVAPLILTWQGKKNTKNIENKAVSPPPSFGCRGQNTIHGRTSTLCDKMLTVLPSAI